MASLRDDYVGITLARFYELQIHRFDGLGVSFDDPFHGLAALHDIACHDSHEPVVIVRIDEYLDIHEFAKLGIREDKDSFYNDDIRRLYCDSLCL